jgi:hypothetical protein
VPPRCASFARAPPARCRRRGPSRAGCARPPIRHRSDGDAAERDENAARASGQDDIAYLDEHILPSPRSQSVLRAASPALVVGGRQPRVLATAIERRVRNAVGMKAAFASRIAAPKENRSFGAAWKTERPRRSHRNDEGDPRGFAPSVNSQPPDLPGSTGPAGRRSRRPKRSRASWRTSDRPPASPAFLSARPPPQTELPFAAGGLGADPPAASGFEPDPPAHDDFGA